MELVQIQKQERVNEEFATKNMSLTSTLKSLTELGYDYVKDLGIGQFGKVVEMINPSTKTNCAIKIVKEEHITDGELYAWPGLCHKNILQLLGFHYLAEDRTFIFVTKKYPSSLDEKLGDVGFIFDYRAFDRAVSWIRDVAMGVAFLHEKKMAHMDLKTNNVLISDDDRALVTDFGSLSSIEKTSSAYTSPVPYRPPETYALDGSWESVDGLKYDSWTIGMLFIRVFTRNNFCQKIHRHKSFWPQKMYPLLFDILQKKSFATKMRTCFPSSQNCSLKADDALNLIKACLQLDTTKRITVKEALNHRLFGGEVFYELEENIPWNKKIDCENVERLICELKVHGKDSSVCTEERYENNSVKETKSDAGVKLLFNDKNNKKIKVDPVEEMEKASNEKEIKIDFSKRVTASTGKETNVDRNDRNEKTVHDSFVKNTVFKDLEHEVPEESKTDKRMAGEQILSAHTLYKDIKSQGGPRIYLKEMDSRLKQVPETKRMLKIVDWAREKKNSFSKMFACYRSTK